NAADIVHARLIHPIQKLPHVWAERLDVASLPFGVNRFKRQTRFAAAARAGDDRQFPKRKIDINPFEIVLTRASNFDAIIPRWRDNPLFVPDLRTHWRQFQIAERFANFSGIASDPRPLPRNAGAIPTGQTPRLVARVALAILPAPRRLTNRKTLCAQRSLSPIPRDRDQGVGQRQY